MTTDNTSIPSAPEASPSVAPLPALRQIFEELKSGRHWSFGDPVYFELFDHNFAAYADWFSQIGIQLHRDERGFCHATLDKDDDAASQISTNTKTASNLILFTAIWIEALADSGRNIHDEIFRKPEGHRLENLPHLATESHRRLMTDAGLGTAEELNGLLKTLQRLGFATILPDDTFRIRPPFHRLLDICQEYGRFSPAPDTAQNATSSSTPASSSSAPSDTAEK
ncbi:MAG: hypothetical protein LBC18_04405 [Opitutaceae bacterium]|jgi:hypothetical protein|nr:hypothetical protein [Opitutaceae bacterium]